MKREAIAHLLPEVFQRAILPETPLSAILDVMEGLHAPSEEILKGLSATFDPRRTPDRFVPFLAGWVDLDWLFEPFLDERRTSASAPLQVSTGIGHLRELIAAATILGHRSGTAGGLLLFLQAVTGERNFQIEESVPGPDGVVKPFHIRIRAPESTQPHRALIQRIIEFEKPVYVTYELEFGGAG